MKKGTKKKNPIGRPRLKESQKLKKVNVRGKNDIPLTSEDQYIKTRKEINALNKERSKAMERRIASYLKGKRIPGSGLHAKYKGDCEIPFVNSDNGYLVECKLSSQTSNTHGPVAHITFEWLPKIQKEAINMEKKFGVLVIHYHGNNNDFVFISSTTLKFIMDESPFTYELQYIYNNAPIIDIRTTKAGKELKAYTLSRKLIEKSMFEHKGVYGAVFELPDSRYMIMPISTFRMVISHL